MNFVIYANRQRNRPTVLHCTMCQYVECFLLRLLMPLVEYWCMHMPHRPRRPSGVDHAKGSERRMNSNSIVSHATLILLYHASMLTLQNSIISRALWLVAKGVTLQSLEWTIFSFGYCKPQSRPCISTTYGVMCHLLWGVMHAIFLFWLWIYLFLPSNVVYVV